MSEIGRNTRSAKASGIMVNELHKEDVSMETDTSTQRKRDVNDVSGDEGAADSDLSKQRSKRTCFDIEGDVDQNILKEPTQVSRSNSSNSLAALEQLEAAPESPLTASQALSQTAVSASSSMFDYSDLMKQDPCSPFQVRERVQKVLTSWGNIAPMRPDIFLYKLLESRGYDSAVIPPRDFRMQPTDKMINDYDNVLVDAVRLSDIDTLVTLQREGRSMNACNKYSESVLHMAARRSDFQIIEFMMRNGGDHNIVDDYGRTPLHDACWRPDMQFDTITLLLDRNLDMIRTADIRGACPLAYVRQDQWLSWCAYLFHQKERYWSKLEQAAFNDNANKVSVVGLSGTVATEAVTQKC